MRIFEDILDDIDITDETSPINKLSDDSLIDLKQFKFILYIGGENNSILFSATENLKKYLDVYLDSYWTDETLYTFLDDVFDKYRDKGIQMFSGFDLLNAQLRFASIWQKFYINFDNNFGHLIKLFDLLSSLEERIELYQYNGSNIEYIQTKDGFSPVESFLVHSKSKFKNKSRKIEDYSNLIYDKFYLENKVLNFKGIEPDNIKEYITDKVTKYMYQFVRNN